MFQKVRFRLPEVALGSAPGIVLLAAGGCVFALLSTPPVMYDALNYHLAFPSHWLDASSFVEFERHSYSYFPSAHGMVYGIALSTVGPWGAQAMHWWMGALAILAAATLGERMGGRSGALWAAACFGLTPAVLEIAGYPIADLAVAAWGGAAVVALTTDRDGRVTGGNFLLAGLLVGTAAAAKYLALATVAMPVGLLAVWMASSDRRRPRWTMVALFCCAAILALLPWLIRNAVWTGNPLYPYLQGVFGGPPSVRDLGAELGPHESLSNDWLRWAWSAMTALAVRTFEPLRTPGTLGPIWLMLLPVAVLIRGGGRRLRIGIWVVVATGLLAWGSLVPFARFALPILVPAAALTGTVAAALTNNRSTTIRWAFRVLLIAVFSWNATVVATGVNVDRLAEVTGHISRQEFLDRWVSYAPAIEAVEYLDGDGLLLVAEARSLFLPGPVFVEDPYRVPWLVELSAGCRSGDELADKVRKLGATHVLINQQEMPRLARLRGASDYWDGSTAEQRMVIDEFLNTTIRPVFQNGWLSVAEVPAGHVK